MEINAICEFFLPLEFYQSYVSFWRVYPALLYGLILFLGSLFALLTPLALIPFILLLHKKHLFESVLLFLLPCVVAYQFYTFPPSGAEVEGMYIIQSMHKNERFGGGWSYRGVLKTEEGRIFCLCFAKEYMPAHTIYRVKGKLRALHGKRYALKIKGEWEEAGSRFTLANLRCKAQESVKRYIVKQIPQPRAAQFLTGMVTGQLEDKVMQKEFSQLGLSHLMAISGLHFSLIALALHLLLRLFLPCKVEALVLMSALTLYFLFVGNTPSILRAWTMAIVFLVGLVVERRSSAINSLGTALCISLLWDPLSALTLSFQLSFLATGGILFFFTPCDRLLQHWLPKRALADVIQKHCSWQYGYIGFSLLREAFALTAAVHLTLLPLLLGVFHSFPLSSLFYNLFFPFLASLSLLIFLASLALGPWLNPWAHLINGYYCDWILRITESPPVQFKTFYVADMPHWLLTGLLTGVLVLAIHVKKKKGTDGLCIADSPLLDHL